MLWLHIGMPKTGSTALQGFVRKNGQVMAGAGLHYMETGRRRTEGQGRLASSHNLIAFHMNQTDQPVTALREAMAREYAEHEDKACLVSSEMLYSVDLHKLAEIFAEIPAREMRIAFYCRRYSDFFEADYKQRAKNGRLAGGGSEYIRTQLDEIRAHPERFSFASAAARIRSAFPGVSLVPMLYERSEMANGNIVDDFLDRIGVQLPLGSKTETSSNPSHSRAACEAFGVVTRAMGRKKSRQLRRRAVDDPVMMRKNDVLEPDERAWLDAFMANEDVSFHQEFFPDRTQLFAPVRLSMHDQSFRRDTAAEYQALRQASEIVFRMALEG